jgi:hypothetical protein
MLTLHGNCNYARLLLLFVVMIERRVQCLSTLGCLLYIAYSRQPTIHPVITGCRGWAAVAKHVQ